MKPSSLVTYLFSDSDSSSNGGWSGDEHDLLGLKTSDSTDHQSPGSVETSADKIDSQPNQSLLLPNYSAAQVDNSEDISHDPSASHSRIDSPPANDSPTRASQTIRHPSTSNNYASHLNAEPPLPVTSSSSQRKYAIGLDQLPLPMKQFLKELKKYFTKPVNLERQRPAIALSTFGKAQERFFCFLGFANDKLHLPLTPELFLRMTVIEDYLTYLKEERHLSSSTMANHAASLIYPAKFLHPEHSPEYEQVPIIRQLRGQVANLQREGRKERPSSKEELAEQNKWLDWEEIVASVSLQRERMEMARTPLARAVECADLLLLSLYVLIPPSRANEVRTLEILPASLELTSSEVAGKNLLKLHQDGGVTLRFQNYKTVKTYGSDTTVLKNDHELSRLLIDYVENHRSKLVTEHSAHFLLVNKMGKPFSSSSFCGHLKFLFQRLTGVSISINVLRSSFVTHTYNRRDCSDSLKDSLAAALRHSRKQAQMTYDRRTTNERKQMALSLASDLVQEEKVDEDSQKECNESSLKVGEFVGLIEEGSTLDSPRVLIGQILSFQPESQVSLLWFEEISRDEYVFKFEGEAWLESIEALHPVQMKRLKKKPGVYKLCTPPKSIHKAFQ